MLRIGKSYIVRVDGISRLCADLTICDRRTTLWFGVDSAHEEWLALGRADAYVMALLPGAMRGGHEIVCEDSMSERLHHQLTNGLIPTLAFAGELYHVIKITAPLTAEKVPNQGAVGTGFSGGVDSLYTIMRYSGDSELPLTHLAVFHTGNIRNKSALAGLFQQAKTFGGEQSLYAVYVDTNFEDVLSEHYNSSYTFRNLACVLALQGLFAAYLLSSGPNASELKLDLRTCDHYDLLTVNCTETESLSVYLSGAETMRVEKIAALTQWEPSRFWLHPCTSVVGEAANCGLCKKCICDMTTLYALGQLQQYQSVFDVANYTRNCAKRIGFVLASRDISKSCAQTAQLLEARGMAVPKAAYLYEKQFRIAMQNLKANQKGSGCHGH